MTRPLYSSDVTAAYVRVVLDKVVFLVTSVT
jgi:hypothetical protein